MPTTAFPFSLTLGRGILQLTVPGAGSGGSPVVGSFSPAAGSALTAQQQISFSVTSPGGRTFSALLVLAQYPHIGLYEVVYDGANFSSNYSGTKIPITNGFSFSILRMAGWPYYPTIVVVAVDSAGNVNS